MLTLAHLIHSLVFAFEFHHINSVASTLYFSPWAFSHECNCSCLIRLQCYLTWRHTGISRYSILTLADVWGGLGKILLNHLGAITCIRQSYERLQGTAWITYNLVARALHNESPEVLGHVWQLWKRVLLSWGERWHAGGNVERLWEESRAQILLLNRRWGFGWIIQPKKKTEKQCQ